MCVKGGRNVDPEPAEDQKKKIVTSQILIKQVGTDRPEFKGTLDDPLLEVQDVFGLQTSNCSQFLPALIFASFV